jgi:hypothetical protein
MMISAASVSNQHAANFWFPSSPLPSFFTSSNEKTVYPQLTSTSNKLMFDTYGCSSNSGSSPPSSSSIVPACNDFLLERSNLASFNYVPSNNYHSRDDWSQQHLPPPPSSLPPTTTSPTHWHVQQSNKGTEQHK